MKIQVLIAVVAVSAVVMAETPRTVCPADRPVDEMIAEIHRLQAKKNNRNKNPLPTVSCIWGWCRTRPSTPKPIPEPTPAGEDTGGNTSSNPESSSKDAPQALAGESSSKETASKVTPSECDIATENALEAAHNVEVGDYYFERENYRAAVMRYKDAREQKPKDAAIEVRLGRVLEKLNEPLEAVEHYRAAQKLASPEKWAKEAEQGLARLDKVQ